MIRTILEFLNLEPVRNRMQRDAEALRKEIFPWIGELVTWDDEERALTSYHIQEQHPKRWARNAKIVRCKVTSIYYEPLLIFTRKKYSGNRSLVLIRNSRDEYLYQVRGDQIEVVFNGTLSAVIEGNNLYSLKPRRVLASMQIPHPPHPSIIVGKDEIAQLLPAAIGSNGYISRAFSFMKDPEGDVEILFLTIAFWEMAKRILPED